MTPEAFRREVMEWSYEVGVYPKEIHLRKMRRKVASCSRRGRLTFDPSLLYEPDEIRDRVILHELLHMRYPNHGRMFRLALEAYLRIGLPSRS